MTRTKNVTPVEADPTIVEETQGQSIVDATGAPEAAMVIHSAVVPAQPGQALVARADDPVAMIDIASRLASALKDIVERQSLFTVIQGKKYPAVEAWATIGRLDNVVAREAELPIRHEDGSYEAQVELVRLSDGMVIGKASSICGMPDDSPWSKRPEYARRSMAVTRATSRAFRQQYAWIMVLAGYEPTPADEMPNEQAATPVAGGTATRPGAETPPAPAPGHVRLVGSVFKVPDGIRRSPDGEAQYTVQFKVDGKNHHAVTTGALAEALVREAKPSVDDVMEVEGVLLPRGWKNAEGDDMPPIKEIRHITYMAVRGEEVRVPLDAATSTSGTPGTAADPSSASTIGNDGPLTLADQNRLDLIDEAHETFDDMGTMHFGDIGFKLDVDVHIVEARRVHHKGADMVTGTARLYGEDFHFATTHDFDPPPEPGEAVHIRGEFVKGPGSSTIAKVVLS